MSSLQNGLVDPWSSLTYPTGLGNISTGSGITTGIKIDTNNYYSTMISVKYIIDLEMSKIKDLNVDNLQKLLRGTKEDISICIELLKEKTNYTWRFIQSISLHNNYDVEWIINDYINRNVISINLKDEVL